MGRNVVLATGSYARSLPGLEIGGRIITSNEAIRLDEVPASMIVLGGGVIGVELARVYTSFGTDVTIVEALPRLVPAETSSAPSCWSAPSAAARSSSRRGVKVQATQDDRSVTVTLGVGEELTADYLLVAVGRGPNTANAGFEGRGDDGARVRAHRLPAAHQPAGRLRRRRHRAGPAAGAPRASSRASSLPRSWPG